MAFFNSLFKLIFLIGVFFCWLPNFWWSYNGLDDEDDPPSDDYFMSARFLMSTGALITVLGMAYVSLPVDFIPDWIPIFGTIDDLLARMAAGAGLMMCFMGYSFGSDNIPEEFEMIADSIRKLYYSAIPIWQDKIAPVAIPVVKATSIPLRWAMDATLSFILSKSRDPAAIANVQDLLSKGTEL
mmetsp:Transcript_14132/g.20877  ORF Transcript_14132/g.20877 Transcript_14132/m.20877 type:complete len:184 (-) Transcript_14132:235-786(-)|eukprot:CAMPEP_0194247104 /NCGR_PEP_ID=MMETSP0158-20130606/16051_1 /TAXON_ID=33649 /ORGANISM="Thalassionema nitzschioides, Strain L26-B" /LENGTH=183 /DNA_ID=CAMNT_0038983149 /DNA_START=48 /DNA_END=599 /DNA_ORIENTATION=-